MKKNSLPLSSHLLRLLREKECEQLELKATLSSPFKAAKEMAAMAKTIGGNLIIGVEDNGSITGVDNPEEEKAILRDAALKYCSPPLTPVIKTIAVEGRIVIVVFIPQSKSKHMVLDPRGNTLFYVRVKDKNLLASRKTARTLEDGPVKAFSLKQLDRHEKTLVDYLKKHEKITLQEFARCANISRRRALRILAKLQRASLIRTHDFEKRTFYTLNPERGK
jgi:predicted HTH transcriptional regulator